MMDRNTAIAIEKLVEEVETRRVGAREDRERTLSEYYRGYHSGIAGMCFDVLLDLKELLK